jgi:hypothetical protein
MHTTTVNNREFHKNPHMDIFCYVPLLLSSQTAINYICIFFLTWKHKLNFIPSLNCSQYHTMYLGLINVSFILLTSSMLKSHGHHLLTTANFFCVCFLETIQHNLLHKQSKIMLVVEFVTVQSLLANRN